MNGGFNGGSVVYAYAKILILKQITTTPLVYFSQSCCICLCKDTNFKANHNYYFSIERLVFVVYAYAKILILKQITTAQASESYMSGCICLCKDTNFKANHNELINTIFEQNVVYAYAKILILKQITTTF